MQEKLLVALKKRQLHQYQLAGMARISETALSRILWGRVQPSEEVKRRIAKALKMEIEELFDDTDSNQTS